MRNTTKPQKRMNRHSGTLKLVGEIDTMEFQEAINKALIEALDDAFDDDSTFWNLCILSSRNKRAINPLQIDLFLNGFSDDGSQKGAQPIFAIDYRGLVMDEVGAMFAPGEGWEDDDLDRVKKVRDALRTLADWVDVEIQKQLILEAQEKAQGEASR